MNRVMFEGLEHRTFLSVGVLDVPASPLEAPVAVVRAAVKAANYNCTAKVEGLAGTFILKLSINGTNVSGSMYSSSWGGLNTTVTGTLAGGQLALTGKSSTFVLRSLRASVASNGALGAGALAVTQMGMKGTGTFTGTKATTVAGPKAATAPDLVGTFKGNTYNQRGQVDEKITLTVTRQSGGLIWLSTGKFTGTGFVLSDGRIQAMIKETGGTTWIHGKYVGSTRKLTGNWEWDGKNGGGEEGTFSFTRQ